MSDQRQDGGIDGGGAPRYPEAAGAAVYVRETFGSNRLSQATGLMVAAVAIFLAARLAA